MPSRSMGVGRGKGGGPKRTKAQRDKDLIEMAQLRIDGWNRPQLAQRFGISTTQVDRDLIKIHRDWERERNGSIDHYRDQARLREMQVRRLALTDYLLSKNKVIGCMACTDQTQAQCQRCKGSGRVLIQVPGNSVYLRIINDCDEALRAIDGVDVQAKNLPTVLNVISLDRVMREQEAKALAEGESYAPADKIERELQRRYAEIEAKEGKAEEYEAADIGAQVIDPQTLPIGLKELGNGEETNGETGPPEATAKNE